MKPVTQRDKFGCGVAGVAFILKKDYSEIVSILGREKAKNSGFYCKELIRILAKFGFIYSYKYLKPKLRRKIYKSGVMVFIKRSKEYPAGHYLVRHGVFWMDPWTNFISNNNVKEAESGFRKKLPGIPIYGLFLGSMFT